jgi:hypothetical protein
VFEAALVISAFTHFQPFQVAGSGTIWQDKTVDNRRLKNIHELTRV